MEKLMPHVKKKPMYYKIQYIKDFVAKRQCMYGEIARPFAAAYSSGWYSISCDARVRNTTQGTLITAASKINM